MPNSALWTVLTSIAPRSGHISFLIKSLHSEVSDLEILNLGSKALSNWCTVSLAMLETFSSHIFYKSYMVLLCKDFFWAVSPHTCFPSQMFKLCTHSRAINKTSFSLFLSPSSGKSYQNFPLCTKCQVLAHIAEDSERFSLIFSCTCFSVTHRIFWPTQRFLANTLVPPAWLET